jgi:ZIP family zinc transporter
MDFTGLLLGACAGLIATTVGASGVLAFKRIYTRFYATIVAFCAGMMGFSALEMINESHALTGHRLALASLLVGMTAFLVLGKLLPHAHVLLTGSELSDAKRKVALLIGTITIHNIPEGFAIASAFATSSSLGWLVTLSIALQDIPEGLIVAVSMACLGVSTRRSFLCGVMSGVVEFSAAIGGFLLLRVVASATPLALGFSGGAMAFVILSELLPDAIQAEGRYAALASLIAGFVTAYGFAALVGF